MAAARYLLPVAPSDRRLRADGTGDENRSTAWSARRLRMPMPSRLVRGCSSPATRRSTGAPGRSTRGERPGRISGLRHPPPEPPRGGLHPAADADVLREFGTDLRMRSGSTSTTRTRGRSPPITCRGTTISRLHPAEHLGRHGTPVRAASSTISTSLIAVVPEPATKSARSIHPASPRRRLRASCRPWSATSLSLSPARWHTIPARASTLGALGAGACGLGRHPRSACRPSS